MFYTAKTFSCISWFNSLRPLRSLRLHIRQISGQSTMVLRGMEFGGEVHLECASKLGRRAKGEVYVLAEHLGDVGTRDLHALREVGLGDAQLLHAQKNLSQERRADMIDCLQERSWSSELELESGGGDFFLVGVKSWSWRAVCIFSSMLLAFD